MTQKILTIISCLAMALASALSALFILKPGLARAYVSPGKPTGYVNDFAKIIEDNGQESLEATLTDFSNTTSNQIVVVTVNSLDGDSIENYANELFREWGIGTKERNNGVLLIVAPNERRVRIEVGYGLEGAITDLESSRIIDGVLTPAFRQNDYTGGITSAIEALKTAAVSEYNSPVAATQRLSLLNGDSFFFIIFGFVWVASFLARSKSWWAGGIIGGIIALIGWFIIDSLVARVSLVVIAPILGLFLDWLVSKNYQKNIARGGKGGFFSTMGGFSGGRGGGGGFGGFSGGSSGGGGSSGSW